MIYPKTNKISDLYIWFKQSLTGIPAGRERIAVADEVFLHVLGMGRDQRVVNANERVSETGIVKLIKAQKRLNQGEPVQYVTGVSRFLDHLIHVRRGVLIPRPETEGLVLWMLQKISTHPQRDEAKLNFLDIGTGSGCIAISLAASLPKHHISACDKNDKILEVAKHNSLINNVSVDFFNCDVLKEDSLTPARTWDYIVSNPPYVRLSEKQLMSKHVVDHEPECALFVKDDDPLLFYRSITDKAKHSLKKDGWLFFEINEAMGKACRDMMISYGFRDVEVSQDIHGRDRYVAGRLSQ